MKIEEEEIFDWINSKMSVEEVRRMWKKLRGKKPRSYRKILDKYVEEIASFKEELAWKKWETYGKKVRNVRSRGIGFMLALYFGWLPGFAVGRTVCDILRIPYTSPEGIVFQALGTLIIPLIGGIGTLYSKNAVQKYSEKRSEALSEVTNWLKLQYEALTSK